MTPPSVVIPRRTSSTASGFRDALLTSFLGALVAALPAIAFSPPGISWFTASIAGAGLAHGFVLAMQRRNAAAHITARS